MGWMIIGEIGIMILLCWLSVVDYDGSQAAFYSGANKQ
jgi:hypothetical protein